MSCKKKFNARTNLDVVRLAVAQFKSCGTHKYGLNNEFYVQFCFSKWCKSCLSPAIQTRIKAVLVDQSPKVVGHSRLFVPGNSDTNKSCISRQVIWIRKHHMKIWDTWKALAAT